MRVSPLTYDLSFSSCWLLGRTSLIGYIQFLVPKHNQLCPSVLRGDNGFEYSSDWYAGSPASVHEIQDHQGTRFTARRNLHQHRHDDSRICYTLRNRLVHLLGSVLHAEYRRSVVHSTLHSSSGEEKFVDLFLALANSPVKPHHCVQPCLSFPFPLSVTLAPFDRRGVPTLLPQTHLSTEQCISPILIILRVARGRAWTKETISDSNLSRLRFGGSRPGGAPSAGTFKAATGPAVSSNFSRTAYTDSTHDVSLTTFDINRSYAKEAESV